MVLWSAFLIGLAGSLHCVGMCGPIAMALPHQGNYQWEVTGKLLLYHLGRIFTYSLLGLLIGAFGQGLFLAGLQMQLSISLGALLLLVALFSIDVETAIHRLPPIQWVQSRVRVMMSTLLRSRRLSALFGLGMLNGLLPCGLVYMAIVGAVATASFWQGALFMALFGAGTIPLMLATSIAGQFIGLKWRNRLRKLVPALLVVFAILFIYRGLQFNLPADMRFWESMEEVPMCH